MSLKSFSTSTRQQEVSAFANPDPIEFDIDGETFTALAPTGSQLTLVFAEMAEGATPAESARAMLDFIRFIFSEDDYARIRERLSDRNDPLDIDILQDILLWLTEVWTARPPTSSTASSPSRSATGRSSTARRRSTA